jgi:hypothetical protein
MRNDCVLPDNRYLIKDTSIYYKDSVSKGGLCHESITEIS